MKDKIVIALSSKLGGGKDSFADFAVENYGFKKISLAGLLKSEVEDFLIKNDISFSRNNLYGSQAEKEQLIGMPKDGHWINIVKDYPWLEDRVSGLTFRYLLQLWGTEYRRAQNDNYWVDAFDTEASKYDRVICSDLRFKNEYKYFMSSGAKLIRIERPDAFKSNTSTHISEIDLDDVEDWHYTIYNNGTFDMFMGSVKHTIEDILRGEDE